MRLNFKKLIYLVVACASISAAASSFVEFFRAVGRDDPRTTAALLQRGFDPNSVDESGQSALYVAIREEAAAVFDVLMSHPGLRVDAANARGETALMMAALRGRKDWAERLLERGAALNREGWTPLHYAASGPQPEVVALLLERGAAIDAISPAGTTALMLAARFGMIDSARMLVAKGANVGAKAPNGSTAADHAMAAGRDALAEELRAAQARRP